MRRPFIAGNWKMNLTHAECGALATGVAAGVGELADCDVAICPPFVYLETVLAAVGGTSVKVGAQNLYPEPSGAFTGEISAPMLADLGAAYVILGHSERRHILGETDAEVFAKVKAALSSGLLPIVCVGETLEQREAGQTHEVVSGQFQGSLAELSEDEFAQVTIAYEPVWAIGTGKVATPEQAEEVHSNLRNVIESRYNTNIAAAVRMQYGGSVKPDNVAELMAQENIDGALVGGASLSPESFLGIVHGAAGQ
jgi:triosephosphate isomerase